MSSSVSFPAVVHCLRTLSLVAVDLVRLVARAARPRAAWVAENLFLRKQLALFQERKVRPRRADASTRWMRAALSPWFASRDALGECPSRHAPALAPPRIPPLPAWEVEDDRPMAPAQQPPRVDPRDGCRQSVAVANSVRREIARTRAPIVAWFEAAGTAGPGFGVSP